MLLVWSVSSYNETAQRFKLGELNFYLTQLLYFVKLDGNFVKILIVVFDFIIVSILSARFTDSEREIGCDDYVRCF